jgi:hypothetical protein
VAVIYKRIGYKWTTQGGGGSSGTADRYLRSFDTPDWTLSGDDYLYTVPFSSHNISINPSVTVYLDNGANFEEVILPYTVDSSGDITIYVSSAPDNRFKGKLVII